MRCISPALHNFGKMALCYTARGSSCACFEAKVRGYVAVWIDAPYAPAAKLQAKIRKLQPGLKGLLDAFLTRSDDYRTYRPW